MRVAVDRIRIFPCPRFAGHLGSRLSSSIAASEHFRNTPVIAFDAREPETPPMALEARIDLARRGPGRPGHGDPRVGARR